MFAEDVDLLASLFTAVERTFGMNAVAVFDPEGTFWGDVKLSSIGNFIVD